MDSRFRHRSLVLSVLVAALLSTLAVQPGTPVPVHADPVSRSTGPFSGTDAEATIPASFHTGPAYAVIHYFREDGSYGDHTTGDFNDYWGLHLWGDIEEVITWTSPKLFLGEDEYGRFAWVQLVANATSVSFIVHRGDVKDGTTADRSLNPSATREIWIRSDDAAIYTSQAEAQGFVTVRYHRDDGDYGNPNSPNYWDFWGLHVWGEAIAPSDWTSWGNPLPPDGYDDYGAFWKVPIVDASQVLNFIPHRGDQMDPGPDQGFVPLESATVWVQSGDEVIYSQRGAAEDVATIHYHRGDGDYGNPASPDFNNFWGLHVRSGAANPNPGWTDPVRPSAVDVFGLVFEVPLVDGASELAYVLHRGDTKDPGPDQFLTLARWGYEVWQLEGEGPDPSQPHYVHYQIAQPLHRLHLPAVSLNAALR